MRSRTTATLAGLALLMTLVGCQSTSSTGHAEPKGFLGDYSMLKPGTEGQAQLVYVNPDVDFASYKRIIFDPVTFWFSHDSKLTEISSADRKMLAQHLVQAVHKRLGKDYEFVQEAAPDTMRLRFAITEARGSTVVGDVVSTVLPVGRIVSAGKKLVTGTNSWVGKAGIEIEVVDSLTGKRLGAAVDERAGGKTLSGVGSTWDDVEKAFDYWAERLGKRLEELRSQGN